MAVKTKDPIDKGMIRVLVYGTLKQGHCNHVLIEEAEGIFLGFDSITGPYNMWNLGNIPAVMDSTTGNRTLRGELWAIKPDGLASLDMLEGHPNLYRRRKIWTDRLDRRAWVYMLHAGNFLHEGAEEVKAGLWQAGPDESKFWLKQRAS